MSEICDNVDLLGCLDGTAGHEDVRHVASCETCRRERDRLERQVRVLTVHFRGSAPCPTPERLVEAAHSDETDDTNLADHLRACSDCAAEWKQILESIRRTRGLESSPVPLPQELSSTLRRSPRVRGGKLIDRAERFKRSERLEELPAAAQPEDLTDTTEESSSRTDAEGDEDDTD